MVSSTTVPRQGERAVGYGLRKDVGRTGLLFTRVDAIIGWGWLFGALYVSQIVGPAAIVSLAVAGLMVMVIGLVYAELAVMFPVSGGIIRFPHYALGSLASYSSGWTSWLAAAVGADRGARHDPVRGPVHPVADGRRGRSVRAHQARPRGGDRADIPLQPGQRAGRAPAGPSQQRAGVVEAHRDRLGHRGHWSCWRSIPAI